MRADTGELFKIGDLAKRVHQISIPVYSLDNNWKLSIRKLTKAFSSGKKQLFELKTQSGRVIKASANHPFRCLKGWVNLNRLKVDDKIALPRIYNHVSRTVSLSDNELILLAHLLGDGCTLPRQPIHYTSGDLENINIVKKTAKELFGISGRIIKQKNWHHVYLSSPYRLTHGKHHPITDWYRYLGIGLSRSYEKEIPLQVFCSSNEKIELFLKHLWATDGNISWKRLKRRKISGSIYYSSTSYKLIWQVQHLLLRLGISSTIRKSIKKGYRCNWQVHIQGAEEQINFLQMVGCYGKRGKIIPSLIKALKKVVPNPNNDVVPKEVWKDFIQPIKDRLNFSWRDFSAKINMSYCGSSLFKNGIGRKRLNKIAGIFSDKNLKMLAESDVFWDRIVDIKPLGVEEVYDATVEGTHNFVANDIIIHNSIEQDADVVMFLYQEDETDDLMDQSKRMIKLFIAKHRNGATGEMDLMFRGDRVKFYSVEKTI